jgi:hypothetical protein
MGKHKAFGIHSKRLTTFEKPTHNTIPIRGVLIAHFRIIHPTFFGGF